MKHTKKPATTSSSAGHAAKTRVPKPEVTGVPLAPLTDGHPASSGMVPPASALQPVAARSQVGAQVSSQISARRERILTIAHGHPDFSLGGGEMAAYQLHQSYAAQPEVEAAWFLARHSDPGTPASGRIRVRRDGEFLWEQGMGNYFLFKAENIDSTLVRFRELIETLRPTVVHFHHYLQIGLEAIRVVRQVDPRIKILMTLHEMQAICFHDGQMVKFESLRLCDRESPDDCRGCFPGVPREAFWLRKRFIEQHFAMIDQFVTPSAFLKARYVAWGLPAGRIAVVENGHSAFRALPGRDISRGGTRNRFAYFGQINPYKGIDVILRALANMTVEERAGIRVEVHGANIEQQSQAFRDRIDKLKEPLVAEGVLRWVGPYIRDELPRRMARIDWVIVPSIWWENSPMVIQEAFAHGRPVLCSNIGGMAEKVRDGIDGMHVDVGNHLEWADTMLRAAHEDTLWDRLSSGITAPFSHHASVQAHLGLMAALQNNDAQAAAQTA